jgi:hypothetical protein
MLSRRRFLQLAGITVAAAHLPRFAAAAPHFDPIYGRALRTVPIYAAPYTDAPIIKQMWSDTIAPILEESGDWYRLRKGYALRQDLQPMIAPARPNLLTATPPFWGTVSGAIAVVREWCAVSAPIVTRIGHGGVLRVIDVLPGEGIDWYGVAETENGDLLGWTMAAVWSPAEPDDALPHLILAIDTAAQRMNVQDGEPIILTAPISTGRSLAPGIYPRADQRESARSGDHHGAAWNICFGHDLDLAGVYWHNAFGAPIPGAALQVTPPLAKWLYPRAAQVIIS